MKIKNSKKLSLAKETLKILNAADLAQVQGGAHFLLYSVVSRETGLAGTSSNSF